MDKRKVISAYRRGFITMQECAQILGLDPIQVTELLDDPAMSYRLLSKRSVNG